MKSLNLRLGIVVAGLSLAAAPVFAQKPSESGSATPVQSAAADRASSSPASSSGSAVDRGSGGGGGAISSASGGGSTISSGGGGTNFSSPSAAAATNPSLSFGDRSTREFAPMHRAGYMAGNDFYMSDDGQKAAPRSSGPSGGGGGGTAVTRGSGGSSGEGSSSSGGGTRAGSGDGGGRTVGRMRTGPAPENASGSSNASGAREVPTWSRPRGDRATTGTAVDRTVPPNREGNRGRFGSGYYYDPYGFYGYGYGPGYGYGNYGFYSPYPYGFGMGYGLYSGFGWAPYYGDPFGDPYGGGYGYYGGSSVSYGRGEQGNLKLKVKPRSAKVYVDGYFVGYVEQFDGAFQKLALNTGRHKVEVKADGFESAEFDVLINPQQTVTFQGELKRIQ